MQVGVVEKKIKYMKPCIMNVNVAKCAIRIREVVWPNRCLQALSIQRLVQNLIS